MRIVDSGTKSAEDLMNIDQELLSSLDPFSPIILHLYEWKGHCLTYGHFINPDEHLNREGLIRYDFSIAKRPTGGGIIFHLTDFAFSLLIPASHPSFSHNTLHNYAWVNSKVAKILSTLFGEIKPELFVEKAECTGQRNSNFCMAGPTQYDLTTNGLKMVGAAQRKTKQGYLHQGTISLALPELSILQAVLKDPEVPLAMQKNSFVFLDTPFCRGELIKYRKLLRNSFLDFENQ